MANSHPLADIAQSHPYIASTLSVLNQDEASALTRSLISTPADTLNTVVKAYNYLESVLKSHAEQTASFETRHRNLESELQETLQDLNTTRNNLSTTRTELTNLQATSSSGVNTPSQPSTVANDGALQREAQLQAQIDSLSAANHILNNSLTAANHTLTLTAATPSVSTLNSSSRPRGEDPDKFSGEEKDTFKRHTAYLVWKGKIQDKWLQNPTYYATEMSKLLHARGLLTGSAFLSTGASTQTLHDNPNDSSKWKWPTAKAFLEWLDAKYIVSSITSMATAKLQAHKMEGKFNAFPDFLTEFTNLADQANMADEMRVHYLRSKLPKNLSDAIDGQLKRPSPTDWAGWAEMCTTLWTNRESSRQLYATSGQQHHFSGPNSAPPPPAGDPMDLDRMNLRRVQVTPLEKAYREENGLCRRCGGIGHRAKDCSDDKARSSPRSYNTADLNPQARRPYSPTFNQSRGNFAARGNSSFRGNGRGGFQGGFQPRSNSPFNPQLRQIQFDQPRSSSSSPVYDQGFVVGEADGNSEYSGSYFPPSETTYQASSNADSNRRAQGNGQPPM